jgi:hypothetical protein
MKGISRPLLCASLAAALVATAFTAPSGAALREFTGTVAVTEQSGNANIPPTSGAGTGVANSFQSGPNVVNGFAGVAGFMDVATSPTFAGGTLTLEFSGIGPASFAATTLGALRGPMPVRGAFFHMTTPAGPKATLLELTSMSSVGLGLGGALGGLQGLHRFATWRTDTVTLTGVFTQGGNIGSTTAMGFDNRTASGMGVVQLVTPTVIDVSGIPADFFYVTRLTLEFTPEPGRMVSLVSGSLALLLLARRRRS